VVGQGEGDDGYEEENGEDGEGDPLLLVSQKGFLELGLALGQGYPLARKTANTPNQKTRITTARITTTPKAPTGFSFIP